MTEVDERTMAFEFNSEKDKEQILDMSPWSVQGHSLNLKDCEGNTSLDEVDFHMMQMWIQVCGLSLEMHNRENATNIANSIGRCIMVEEEIIERQRIFMRVKVEIDVNVPLMEGFWWTTKSGEEKWATIKYERLSDICYGW